MLFEIKGETMLDKSIIKSISEIDDIFISNKFCEMMNEQSCDCDELIIKSGEKLTLLTLQSTDGESYISFREISEIDKEKYIYAVDLSEEKFKYDKSLLLGSGRVEGIRFVFRDVHLFIFALEYNLVLTKSKYDLFCEKDTSVLDEENEAKLRIRILR